MPRKLNKIAFPRLPRVKQKTLAHCGPAVLEMLVGYLGKKIDQDKFVAAAQVKHKFKRHGMNVVDMGAAIKKLTPTVNFWYKEKATLREVQKIIHLYKTPVGVEWQGVFGSYSDGDDGHYSIITCINRRNKMVTIADPFPKFAGSDRIFTFNEFQKRWWDFNEVKNPKTKKMKRVKDHHMLFVVTSKRRRFPKKFKLQSL